MSSESDGFRTGFSAGVGFLLGLATGAILGLLCAPKPGVELRKDIKEKTAEIYVKGKEAIETATEKIKSGYEASKKKIADAGETVSKRVQEVITPEKASKQPVEKTE
jgi:gas vesicle protein